MKKNHQQPNINCECGFDCLASDIPNHIRNKLRKIAAKKGTNIFLIVSSEVTKYVMKNYNYKKDEPK